MNRKKFLSLFLALVMALSLTAPVMAGSDAGPSEDDGITIPYTNGIHSYIDDTWENDAGETVVDAMSSEEYAESFSVDSGAALPAPEADMDSEAALPAPEAGMDSGAAISATEAVMDSGAALSATEAGTDSGAALPAPEADMDSDAAEGRIGILAAEPEETGGTAFQVEARFHFSPSLTGGQAEAPCMFDPAWFFQSARSEYPIGLLRLSIRTAMAAFGTDAVLEPEEDAEAVTYLSEEAADSTSANIVQFMRDLGFSRITADYQDPGLDTIGYSMASRPVSSGTGETARLILIAVRGGGYRQEWASNFTIGLADEHQGFGEAAAMVVDTAEAYLADLRNDGYDGPVKFWVTGYSRGAAVANLTAQRLSALADADAGAGFTRDDVFACCLACPRNVISEAADSYDNIVNIVHYADFVPKIPVAPWGYGRYGRTYYLPSPELTARYPEAAERMTQSLLAFLGTISPEQDTAVATQAVGALSSLLPNQGRLTDRFTNTLAVHVGSQSAYVSMVQDAFRNTIQATEGRDGFGAFFYVLSGLPDYYERYEQSLLPIINNGTQIGLAHAPELYLAWLDALDCPDEYVPEGRSRVLVVNGPADILVTSADGSPAAQMTGSDAAGSTLPAYVDPDGQKLILLPPDGAFRVEVTATDSGTVSYQIEETDLETGVTDRVAGYYEIPVEVGTRLTGETAALAVGESGVYPLSAADGLALTPDADIWETVENCRVTVSIREPADGMARAGSASGGGLYVPGEYAQASAAPADGFTFTGWYDESGEPLSAEPLFRFRVTEDRTVTAAFSEVLTTYQVIVEGGSGGGTYQPGDSVTITAGAALTGQVFDRWTGDDDLEFTAAGADSATAVFTMPDHDVTLAASYRPLPTQGCYVATAVYGSYDCPEVWTLRRYRDEVLAETWYGRLFIKAYYAVSPAAVKLFGNAEWFQNFFRGRLDTMVAGLQTDGFASTPYQDRIW